MEKEDEFEDAELVEDPYYPETKRVCVGKTRSGREVYTVKRLVVTLPDNAEEGAVPQCDMSDLSDKSVTDDEDDESDETSLDSFIDDDDDDGGLSEHSESEDENVTE